MRREIIEASAGTGKTYTICEEVARLVGAGLGIEKILLVTFTEKAAGELRYRIREKLVQSLESDPESHFRIALKNLDQISIHTIHGFCQRLLTEYSFELCQPLRSELVDDRILLNELLQEEKRSWPALFGDDLPGVLLLSKFPFYDSRHGSKFERDVIAVASVQSELLPDFKSDMADRNQFVSSLKVAATAVRKYASHRKELAESFEIAIKNTKSKRTIYLTAFSECMESMQKSDLEMILTFVAHVEGDSEKYMRGLPRDFVHAMDDLLRLKYFLSVYVVRRLRAALGQHKRAHGLVSYEDMLNAVADSVENNPLLVSAIRARYDCALVDEFQDTDAVQWRIFKKIFLESDRGTFIVVGDPKQSIYSFRGANLHMYKRAREEISNHKEVRFLSGNYRTSAPLLLAFERLFSRNWFQDLTPYHPLTAEKQISISGAERAAANFVRLSAGKEKVDFVRTKYAKFVAAEISRLKRSADLIKDGIPLKLKFSDFCVLVRARREAEIIERQLKRAGIPYSYYKKPGLYNSIEALEWLVLLTAVQTPEPRSIGAAMLTSFFRATAYQAGSDNRADAIEEKIRGWHDLAVSRKWGQLFRSILDETGVRLPRNRFAQDGMNLDDELDFEDPYERRSTNLIQIAHELEIRTRKNGLSIGETVNLLASVRLKQVQMEEDADLLGKETEESRVQIMTMHASKGLEFPVVFISGGYYDNKPQAYFSKSIDSDSMNVICDFTASHNGDEKRQRVEEDARIFYVAMTRAQVLVYLPYFGDAGKSGGPLVKIVHECVHGLLGDQQSLVENGDELIAIIDHQQDIVPIESSARRDTASPVIDELYHDLPENLQNRFIGLNSYSSISRYAKSFKPPREEFISVEDKSDESDSTPGGAAFGIAIHRVLELLDYSEFNPYDRPPRLTDLSPESRDIITRELSPFTPDLDPSIAMIWNTLKAQIIDGVRLCDVSPEDRMHELRFLMKSEGLAKSEGSIRDGYMHGAIDLIFRANDKYYIVDWKSNFIAEGYAPERLKEKVESEMFDMQSRIYSLALVNWLKSSLPDFDPERNFGGSIYLFLRGMQVETKNGIHFDRSGKVETLAEIVGDYVQADK